MIIVTGATGALNGATVDHLLERVPAKEIAVTVPEIFTTERSGESSTKSTDDVSASATVDRPDCHAPTPTTA